MKLHNRILRFFGQKSAPQSTWFEIGSRKNTNRTEQELYVGTVYACVDAIAQSCASVEPLLYEYNRQGEPTQIFEHQALEPLWKANRFQTFSDIIYRVSSHIDIWGKAFVYPVKNLAGYPLALWSLDPRHVRIVKAQGFELIRGYVYEFDGIKIPFEVDELVPIFRPNPFDQYGGISTIQMARNEVESDLDAVEYNKAFFARGARPDGVLTTDSEDPIDESVFERLKQQWYENYAGKGNEHKTMILEQGLKYQQLSLNQKDMDFIQSRKFSRDEILSIFKVPKPIIGITEDVNLANAQTGEYIFAKYTVEPRLRLIYDKLSYFYLPMFKNSENLYLSFTDVVPQDELREADIRAKEVNVIKTVNEARAEIGLDAVDGGDMLYVPMSSYPISEPRPEVEQPAEQPKDSSEAKQKSVENYIEKLLSRHRQTKRAVQLQRDFIDKQSRKMSFATRQLYTDFINELKKEKISKDLMDTPEVWLAKIMPSFNNFKQTAYSVFLKYSQVTWNESQKNNSETFGIDINFDFINQEAINQLQARAKEVTTGMTETMLDKARKVIADVQEEGNFSIPKAKKAIIEAFEEILGWQAERIARTETAWAYGEANHNLYTSSGGIVEKVIWIAHEPCDLCSQNADKIVQLGEAFPSGDLHEPAHPNCRCTVAPYFGIKL